MWNREKKVWIFFRALLQIRIFFYLNFSCNSLNKKHFEEFMFVFKRQLEPYNVSVSASFNGSVDILADAFTYSNLSKHLDFMQFTMDTVDANNNERKSILYLTYMINHLEKCELFVIVWWFKNTESCVHGSCQSELVWLKVIPFKLNRLVQLQTKFDLSLNVI